MTYEPHLKKPMSTCEIKFGKTLAKFPEHINCFNTKTVMQWLQTTLEIP